VTPEAGALRRYADKRNAATSQSAVAESTQAVLKNPAVSFRAVTSAAGAA